MNQLNNLYEENDKIVKELLENEDRLQKELAVSNELLITTIVDHIKEKIDAIHEHAGVPVFSIFMYNRSLQTLFNQLPPKIDPSQFIFQTIPNIDVLAEVHYRISEDREKIVIEFDNQPARYQRGELENYTKLVISPRDLLRRGFLANNHGLI